MDVRTKAERVAKGGTSSTCVRPKCTCVSQCRKAGCMCAEGNTVRHLSALGSPSSSPRGSRYNSEYNSPRGSPFGSRSPDASSRSLLPTRTTKSISSSSEEGFVVGSNGDGGGGGGDPPHLVPASLVQYESTSLPIKTDRSPKDSLGITREKPLNPQDLELRFNVRGTAFTCDRESARRYPECWFGQLTSAPDAPLFVDRDPVSFDCVLDFLKKGSLSGVKLRTILDKHDGCERAVTEALAAEAAYFALDSLTIALATILILPDSIEHLRSLSLYLNFSDTVLVGCFANLDSVLLQGTDLRGADLDYASLVDTVLEHGNMESMRIRHAHFSFADLTACRMSQAVFDHCTFDDCTWKGADLRGAQFLHCDFSSNRNQLGAQLAALATEPDDEGMAGLILKGALFVDCRLGQMNFKGADLACARFEGCNLIGACFLGACLRASVLRCCSCSSSEGAAATFASADLRRAHLLFTYLCRVDFSKARLDHAVISNCQFTGANVTGASFHGVVAVRTDVPFIIASPTNGHYASNFSSAGSAPL